MVERLTLIALAFLASLSPMLTLGWLWQVKEWRWDRLRSHFEREGLSRQVLGRTRIAAVLVAIPALLTPYGSWGFAVVTLALGTLLTLLQFGLRRQRQPVLTSKAILALGLCAAITLGLAYRLENVGAYWLMAFLPLLQGPLLGISWTILWPLDRWLKHRTFAKAEAIRLRFSNLTVIGVTGSVGKTTTKELLSCVLEPLGARATPAYVNSEMGVARWMTSVLSLNTPPPILIVEMGAYRRGEIATLCQMAKPNLGVITHVGVQHVALFGSPENLFRAKAELVDALPKEGHAFLNGDNERARTMRERAQCPVTIVGTGGHCDIEARDIEETPEGIRFTCLGTTFSLALHGTHQVQNVLLAIAVARHVGMDPETISKRLKSFAPLSKTFHVLEKNGITILDDTHNASTSSLRAAIAWAQSQPHAERILLTSGLIELGALQESSEREIGALCNGVCSRVIVADLQSAKNFASGYSGTVETLSRPIQSVKPGSLLLCVGRLAQRDIDALLP